MKTPLTVKTKNVFGVDKIYPVSAAAHVLAQIAGTVTLTRETIQLAKRLGYSFVEQTVEH